MEPTGAVPSSWSQTAGAAGTKAVRRHTRGPERQRGHTDATPLVKQYSGSISQLGPHSGYFYYWLQNLQLNLLWSQDRLDPILGSWDRLVPPLVPVAPVGWDHDELGSARLP